MLNNYSVYFSIQTRLCTTTIVGKYQNSSNFSILYYNRHTRATISKNNEICVRKLKYPCWAEEKDTSPRSSLLYLYKFTENMCFFIEENLISDYLIILGSVESTCRPTYVQVHVFFFRESSLFRLQRISIWYPGILQKYFYRFQLDISPNCIFYKIERDVTCTISRKQALHKSIRLLSMVSHVRNISSSLQIFTHNLTVAILVEKKIFWFQVPINNAFVMEVV